MTEPRKPLEGASALLSFTVENAHSYRDETEFSMLATRFADDDIRRDLSLAGLKNPVGVLPLAGIFGPNASGKTTILRAMADMRIAVRNSFKKGDDATGFRRFPFLLDSQHSQKPSVYGVDIVIEGVSWQYGFVVDNERVIEEYAYYYPKGRRTILFDRDKNTIKFGPTLRPVSGSLQDILRPNSLLLSAAGATSNKILAPLYKWFRDNLLYIDSNSRDFRLHELSNKIRNNNSKERIMNLIREADLGITDIQRVDPDPIMLEQAKQMISIISGEDPEIDIDNINLLGRIQFTHRGSSTNIELDSSLESLGTVTWAGLLYPAIKALDTGQTLLIDEIDSSLHPLLVESLIDLFQSKVSNPKCAQIIFNSHDSSILSDRQYALTRDQVWFTSKEQEGSTVLYPLYDFKPRNGEAFDKRYLQGRYGAIPNLGISSLEIDFNPQEDNEKE